MAMLINVRQKAAVSFRSVVEANAANIGAALEHRLRAFLKEDEKLPDFRLVLVLLARMVADAAAWLVHQHGKHEDELGGGVERRARRDTAAQLLRRKLVDARALLAALLGRRRGSEVLGLEGATAEAAQPDLLCDQARTATGCLQHPDLEVPGVSLGCVLDPAALGRSLEPGVQALRQALDDVERGEERASRTLAARDEAMAELDFVQRASVVVMKGLFMLAGRSDLVRQIEGLARRSRKGGA